MSLSENLETVKNSLSKINTSLVSKKVSSVTKYSDVAKRIREIVVIPEIKINSIYTAKGGTNLVFRIDIENKTYNKTKSIEHFARDGDSSYLTTSISVGELVFTSIPAIDGEYVVGNVKLSGTNVPDTTKTFPFNFTATKENTELLLTLNLEFRAKVHVTGKVVNTNSQDVNITFNINSSNGYKYSGVIGSHNMTVKSNQTKSYEEDIWVYYTYDSWAIYTLCVDNDLGMPTKHVQINTIDPFNYEVDFGQVTISKMVDYRFNIEFSDLTVKNLSDLELQGCILTLMGDVEDQVYITGIYGDYNYTFVLSSGHPVLQVTLKVPEGSIFTYRISAEFYYNRYYTYEYDGSSSEGKNNVITKSITSSY